MTKKGDPMAFVQLEDTTGVVEVVVFSKAFTTARSLLEQDRVVLESMAPEARDHETLYQHDIGITRIRRLLARRAAAELADAPVAMLKPIASEAQHA